MRVAREVDEGDEVAVGHEVHAQQALLALGQLVKGSDARRDVRRREAHYDDLHARARADEGALPYQQPECCIRRGRSGVL